VKPCLTAGRDEVIAILRLALDNPDSYRERRVATGDGMKTEAGIKRKKPRTIRG